MSPSVEKQKKIKKIESHNCWIQFATNWKTDDLSVKNHNKFISDHESCGLSCLFASNSLSEKYCQPKRYGLSEAKKTPEPTANWLTELNKLKADFEKKARQI